MKTDRQKNKSALFINGKVWLDRFKFAESFGICNDKFNFIGTNQQARKIKKNYLAVIDLKGKTVLPGLIDSHMHLVYGSLMKKSVDCQNIKSLDALKEVIFNQIERQKEKTDWIIGVNLNLNAIDINSINENLLDSLSHDIPLFFINYDYHSALANTAAMKASGLLDKISEFTDDELPKRKNNLPLGLLKERAMKQVFNNIPAPSLNAKVNAVSDFIQELYSFGITGVCDILLTEDIDVYPLLQSSENLKLRINSYLPIKEYKNIHKYISIAERLDKDFFNIRGFKIFYDGSLGSQTALYKENYLNQNSNGLRTEVIESGLLPELLNEVDKEGWQLMIHAIGDKAVEETLELYEELIKTNGNKDRRSRIEHAQHIDENDFDRLLKANIIISVQPVHLKYDADLVKKLLPENIVKRTHNYNKLVDKGSTVCFGTDFPIVDINPYENIQTAVTRNIGNTQFFPENCIDIHTCIKCYTLNCAYASFSENNIGSIEIGKKADFVILNEDIFSIPENEISMIKAKETYVNGEKVFHKV